jgi:hypothetical protein
VIDRPPPSTYLAAGRVQAIALDEGRILAGVCIRTDDVTDFVEDHCVVFFAGRRGHADRVGFRRSPSATVWRTLHGEPVFDGEIDRVSIEPSQEVGPKHDTGRSERGRHGVTASVIA